MSLSAYALFALARPNVTVLAVAFALAGIGIGFVETAEHAAVAQAAQPAVRGSAFGLLREHRGLLWVGAGIIALGA